MTRTIDVQYYTPGKGWKARSFKTLKAYSKWAAGLDSDVEVRIAADSMHLLDAEVA